MKNDILCIGIGGAGINTIETMDSKKYLLYAIDSTDRALGSSKIKGSLFPLKVLDEFKTNKKFEKSAMRQMVSFIKKSDEVFFILGMGSDYSFEILQYLQKYVKNKKHLICFFPFDIERARKIKAHIDFVELIGMFDSVFVYDNNYLVKKCGNMLIDEVFYNANRQIERHIENIVGMGDLA